MIFRPKDDGSYVLEFGTSDGEVRSEVAVIRHFQEQMPYGAVRAGGGRRVAKGSGEIVNWFSTYGFFGADLILLRHAVAPRISQSPSVAP